MESTLIKKIKRSKNTFVVFASVLVFFGVFYYVFFVPRELESTNQVAQADLQDTSYQEYRDYVSNTNKGVKNLLDGAQLKAINIYSYPAMDLNIPRNENPFAKSF
ncbi:MAG: hypothetical protein PHX30_05005 [Candidatus Pacebacteria bacterium]|jgi:hypothetical protein|nr:hypothetical protein [Candidatus Paceibacterota bacterium]